MIIYYYDIERHFQVKMGILALRFHFDQISKILIQLTKLLIQNTVEVSVKDIYLEEGRFLFRSLLFPAS